MAGDDLKGAPSDAAGLAAAVSIAFAEDQRERAPDQLALFEPPDDPEGVGEIGDDAPRRRGRPPGSRNKSTDEWVRFLTTRFDSPLIGLAQIAQAEPLALAKALACSPLDAAKLKIQAATTLAPYLHQRLPLSLEIEPIDSLLTLVINAAGAAEPGEENSVSFLTAEDAELVENQAVSDQGKGKSE